MIGYILRRLASLIPLLLIVSFLVFCLTLLIPGDPARVLAGGQNATPAQVDQVRHQLGLDRPFLSQYWHWLVNALHGNLGYSLFHHDAVASSIASKFPVTFSVALGAMIVVLLIGAPTGVLAGTRPGSIADRIITITSSTMLAVPDFWLAIILIVVFAVNTHLLPAIGYVPFSQSPSQWAEHLVLPWIAAGLGGAATLARQLRGAIADVMEQDYIRTAEAKGLHERYIIGKHALKNAAIAPVTVLGIMFAYTLGGTVILEHIFSIPGLGQYFYLGLTAKDLPVIQGVALVVAVTFAVVNLLVDVLYAYLNPKVRLA